MISSILDQAQKLLGRGFLISAFVPSAVVLLLNLWIWSGLGVLREVVGELTAGKLKQASMKILVGILATYLVAYLLYGLRSAVHELYQGGIFRGWLRTAILRSTKQRIADLEHSLREAEARLDDCYWPTRYRFGDSLVREAPDEHLPGLLERVEGKREELRKHLDQHQAVDPDLYGSILHDARRLKVWEPRLGKGETLRAKRVIARLRKDHRDKALLAARRSLESDALREWTDAYVARYERFPSNERWLRPTRYGNRIAVLELYPLQRYGIDLSTLWPRLAHVVTEDAKKRIDDATIFLDFTLMMSFLSALTVGSVLWKAVLSGRLVGVEQSLVLGIHLLVPLASCYVFYLLALRAVQVWSLQMQATVDLFRLKLIDALDLERPHDPESELAFWTDLRRFIAQADPPSKLRFKGAAKQPPG